MAKRVLRFGFFAAPLLALCTTLVSACSDDETFDPITGGDASPDVARIDGSNIVDGNRPDTNRPDAFVPDSGRADADAAAPLDASDASDSTVPLDASDASDSSDASDAADADAGQLAVLCQTYPNSATDAGALDLPYYTTLASSVFRRGTRNTQNACEISDRFQTLDGDPQQVSCFGRELAALAGCEELGAPIDYDLEADENFFPCVDPLAASVLGGFRIDPTDPTTETYTRADFELFLELVREAAVAYGMTAGDAQRLVDVLDTRRRADVVTDDPAADAGAGGFSSYSCP